jgi:hypothetical protein
MPAKHLECSIRSVVWHGPVVTLDTPQTEPTRPWPGTVASVRVPDHTHLLRQSIDCRSVLELRCRAGIAASQALGTTASQAAPVGALQADFNNDGDSDLGVGAPFEAVGADVAAGAISAVPGSTGGLSGVGRALAVGGVGLSGAENGGRSLAGPRPGKAVVEGSLLDDLDRFLSRSAGASPT